MRFHGMVRTESPLPFGHQIGIVADSAGMATLAADACSTRGLLVAQATGQVPNPLVLHIRSGYQDYARGVRGILQDAGVDALMVSYVNPLGGDPEGSARRSRSPPPGSASPPWRASSPPRELPTARSIAVPNYRFPSTAQTSWPARLSAATGSRGHLESLPSTTISIRAAARKLIGSRLDRSQRGNMAGEHRGGGAARHAWPDGRALPSMREHRRPDRRRRTDRRAGCAEGRASTARVPRRPRRGRADRRIRSGHQPTRRLTRPTPARPGRALRTRAALRAANPRNAGDRRSRPHPSAMHDQRLHRTQHAPTSPARTRPNASKPGKSPPTHTRI